MYTEKLKGQGQVKEEEVKVKWTKISHITLKKVGKYNLVVFGS